MIKLFRYSFIAFLAAFLFISCGNYNKVLNRGTNQERYKVANEKYKEKSYDKAIRLYELVLPTYATKPQAEVITFRLADANYMTEDYTTAIYYYEKFIRRYPNSTELASAEYKIAECYYQLSPKFSTDQTDTKNAIEAYQRFIDRNPKSDLIAEANKRVRGLNYKLETKAFEIAKQYFKIGNYKSAIVAFDNVILDHLGTSYKELALFYKFRSAYELGVNSVNYKKEARIKEAIKIYNRYKKAFPKSEYLKDANNLYEKLVYISKTNKEQNS